MSPLPCDKAEAAMNVFLWSDDLSVKDRQLDLEHRRILDSANTIKGLLDVEDRQIIEAAIDEAAEYVDHHFAAEELVMAQRSYADLEGHRAKHDAIRQTLGGLQQRIDRIGMRDVDELMTALVAHIVCSDMDYAHHAGG